MMYGLKYPNASTVMMVEYLKFNDKVLFLMVFVSLFVGMFIIYFFFNFGSVVCYMENKFLEVIWTLVPSLILVFMAFPSLKLLYFLDSNKLSNSDLKVLRWKIIGHQWYWSYECKILNVCYDSFMLKEKEKFRTLEVDLPFVSFLDWMVELNISSSDVIHSFSLPTFGVKMDAVPGRVKSTTFVSKVLGSFYGQCSEICGANHSFMPICLEVVKV